MANIPHKFTQEAEDERRMRSKLQKPKDRWSWSFQGVSQKDWDDIDWSAHRKPEED